MNVVVDFGVGNVGSVRNMIRRLGYPVELGSRPSNIQDATKLFLPGVGSFDDGMKRLNESGLRETLTHRVIQDSIPILGICLGAQMMTHCSEEGSEPGLGWIDAVTVRMNFDDVPGRWPLPNIGWRSVSALNNYPLLNGLGPDPKFYFVHSYHFVPADSSITSLNSEYGRPFTCGMSIGNIHAVQFHPEKSNSAGMKFLKNFLELA